LHLRICGILPSPRSDAPAGKCIRFTNKGRPLTSPTKGNNRNGRIPSAWAGLTKRIWKDQPAFPKLSFNKLRKKAKDMVRQTADGEISGVFICYGQPVKTDDLPDV